MTTITLAESRSLLELLLTNDVYVTRIIETKDAFIILISNDNDLDCIFNGNTDTELENNHFCSQLPPELKAQ